MAQRPIWEGHLRLSLVACPVSLFTATSRASGIHSHPTNPMGVGTPTSGLDTGMDRITLVRGYEFKKDRHQPLTSELRRQSTAFAAGTHIAATRTAVQ